MKILATDILLALLQPKPEADTVAFINQQDEQVLFVAAPTLAALAEHAEDQDKGKRKRAWREAVIDVAEVFTDRIVPFDHKAALAVPSLLKDAEISVLDAQMLAIASTHRATLVTAKAQLAQAFDGRCEAP